MAALSHSLLGKFERTGDIDTVNHSIGVMEEAIRITPHNDQGSGVWHLFRETFRA
jgi:hypothetical protein